MNEIDLLPENKDIIPELTLKKESNDKVVNKTLYRTIQPYNIPTSELYNELIKLICKTNIELFKPALPEVMLRLSKEAGKCGKINNDCWQKDVHTSYEIIFNPGITRKNNKEILIDIVHILCHFQQILNNKESRNNYHNTDFCERMKLIGLSTYGIGKDNGNSTGQSVKFKIIKGSKFEKLLSELKNEDFLPWQVKQDKKSDNKNKIAYICNKCNTKVWGKPRLNLICGKCYKPFVSHEK